MLTALLVFPVLLIVFLLAMERLESVLLGDARRDVVTPAERGAAATGRKADAAQRPQRAGRTLRPVRLDRVRRRVPARPTGKDVELRKSA